MTESQLQARIVKLYNNAYCLTHHSHRCMILSIPNGGTRNAMEAMTLKSTGLLAGASDLIVIHQHPDKAPILYWIEIKTDLGKQSESQKEFEKRITALGYHYAVVRSMNDFCAVVGIPLLE